MIVEIIKSRDGKGTGAGRKAFRAGIRYVTGKAVEYGFRNLVSNSVEQAIFDMIEVSRLSSRVQKPYYHLVCSWHETEQPTDSQILAAIEAVLAELGLSDHQAVLAVHRDTPRAHGHAVVNTIHPITGKAWSKSNDHAKAERAARQVEIDQGWAHDRGRFDFTTRRKNGRVVAELLPRPPEDWEQVKRDRTEGRRKMTTGHAKVEKSTGFAPLDQTITEPMKTIILTALDASTDWSAFHNALRGIGLRYYRFGSGARIGIGGSEEFAKGSSFGTKLSIKQLEKRFGPFEPGGTDPAPTAVEHGATVGTLVGTPAPENEKMTRATAFKKTLIRRVYCAIQIDDDVARQIHRVALDDQPPWISFRNGERVIDEGKRLRATGNSQAVISAMVSMATAKSWDIVRPSGNPDFVRAAALACAHAGLRVTGVPEEVQVAADAALAEARTTACPVAMGAAEARRSHLETQVDRETIIADNAAHAAQLRDTAEEISAEARAVMDALHGKHDPVSIAVRAVARAEEAERISSLPDRRRRPAPQPSPDSARTDKGGFKRLERTRRDNDRDELESLKAMDIGIVAALGGWQDVTSIHPDGHGDRAGARARTYQLASDTIKCSRVEGRWVWTSNKSGKSGSVLDLWLYDNPSKTLGHAREALRAPSALSVRDAQIAARPSETVAPDHTAIRRRWDTARVIGNAPTYAEKRGIARETLTRFSSELRCGPFGGIIAAHRDSCGNIVGFEQRWQQNGLKNAARFGKGGRKTASVLGDPAAADRIIVVESCLDALAVAEIEDRGDTLYVSVGGTFGAGTIERLKDLAEGRSMLAGFDNDAAGERQTKTLRAHFPDAERYAPPRTVLGSNRACKDWLDVLNACTEAESGLNAEGTINDPFMDREPADDRAPDAEEDTGGPEM